MFEIEHLQKASEKSKRPLQIRARDKPRHVDRNADTQALCISEEGLRAPVPPLSHFQYLITDSKTNVHTHSNGCAPLPDVESEERTQGLADPER